MNVQVLSVLLYHLGIISFRAVPGILNILFSCFHFPVRPCHFTSVINWCLKLGLYKLNHISSYTGNWTAIIDASIKWGKKRLLVVLRVPAHIMKGRSKALELNNVEVVGMFLEEECNGEKISSLLKSLFSKLGNPCQILTDGGSDIGRAIRMLSEGYVSNFIHTLDIGHFAANLLKKNYIENDQFKHFISFTSKIGSKLRQTVAAWSAPDKLRVKGRFQGISDLAEWAQKAFEYCKKELPRCEENIKILIEDNIKGYDFLLPFSQKFYEDTQILNEVLQCLKNRGLYRKTLDESFELLSRLPVMSIIRQKMEACLQNNFERFHQHGIPDGLVSTDIIECLFGKFKYIMEQSPSKDFNRLTLLLPNLAGELNEAMIPAAQKEVKIKDILQYDAEMIGNTILKEKRREFGKLESKCQVPKHAKYAA